MASGLETQKLTGDGCADECWKPKADDKSGCADKCCMPTTDVKDICADKRCKLAVDDKNDCADKCCKSAPAGLDSCADDSCQPAVDSKDSCADKCCQPAANGKDICADKCCKPATNNKASDNIHSSCANASGKLVVDNNPSLDIKKSCADSCCRPAVEGTDSCESEKRDCTNNCCETDSQEPSSALASSCGEHVKVAFARYESLIRQGQCLCRRLMQQMNFCCCSGGGTSCSSHADDRERTPLMTRECKTDLFEKSSEVKAAGIPKTPELVEVSAVEPMSGDAENLAAREHVVLTVAGMTCTGCSKKLTNVLNGIPGVHNPKVTFVSGTAAFELDHGAGTINVDGVLPTIEKQTGFKVSRVVSGYQRLDVLVEPSVAQQMEREARDGFVSVEKVCSPDGVRLVQQVSD